MIRYLARVLAAELHHGRTLFLLSVFGVALGVGSVLCIQIINRNALSAFTGSVRAVSGEADLTVVSKTPVLDEHRFPEVLGVPGVEAAWPLVRVDVSLAADPRFFLDVVGIDFFLPVGRPPALEDDDATVSADSGGGLGDVLAVPGWVAVSPALAADRGWSVGDTLRVTSGSRSAVLTIGALVDFQRLAPLATRKLALMDLAQVQSLLTRPGELHQIDVRIRKDTDPETVRAALAARLGDGVRVQTAEQRENRVDKLLEAFRVNLTALSLISLFVGVFLIYSTTQASLVRRRREFGLLRSLGATRGQVLGLILAEVAVLGTVGTAVGIPLGYLAATANVEAVSATLTNIYLLEEIERVQVPWTLYLLAAGIGIGGALLGALGPAWDMSRRETRSLLVAFTLHERVTRLAPRLAMTALGIAALAGGWFALWGRETRIGGFVLGLALLVALPLCTPQFVRTLCGAIPVRGFGFAYSFRTLALKLQTTAVAVAALAVAVSMLVGITLLIGSFRRTLDTWVETAIRADVYITTASWSRAGREATLSADLIEELVATEGVVDAERLRQIRGTTGDREIRIAGLEFARPSRSFRIPLREGDPSRVMDRLLHEGAVLISEPLSRKTGLGVDDTLWIYTPSGEAGLPIAGVSYDYSSEQGATVMHLETLERRFGPGPVNNIALYLAPGRDAERTVDALRARFRETPLVIRSNRELRDEVFRIFDQTFAVTRILQGMALLVAGAGISLSLLVLVRERVAELALYRALGSLRRQLFRVFLGEGLALGLLGLLLGGLAGLGLAGILIYVINPAYFGWTIRPAWPAADLAEEGITILIAALLAALYPAFRASRIPAAELSRDDL